MTSTSYNYLLEIKPIVDAIDEQIDYCGHKTYSDLPELVKDNLIALCIEEDIKSQIPELPEYIDAKSIGELLVSYIRFTSVGNAVELSQAQKEKCHKYFEPKLIKAYESRLEKYQQSIEEERRILGHVDCEHYQYL